MEENIKFCFNEFPYKRILNYFNQSTFVSHLGYATVVEHSF